MHACKTKLAKPRSEQKQKSAAKSDASPCQHSVLPATLLCVPRARATARLAERRAAWRVRGLVCERGAGKQSMSSAHGKLQHILQGMIPLLNGFVASMWWAGSWAAAAGARLAVSVCCIRARVSRFARCSVRCGVEIVRWLQRRKKPSSHGLGRGFW